jgi:cell division protein ZapE
MTPLAEAYDHRVGSGELSRDPAQEEAIRHLDRFLKNYKKNVSPPGAPRTPGKKLLGALGALGGAGFLEKKKSAAVKGVYLYGGVGRGKTMLMDMLVAQLASPTVRRVHFHAFMLEIHTRLKALHDRARTDDFLGQVATDIAAGTKLLCFDELHVNDIADAMILGPLFSALIDRGVAIIATSNYAPQDLYKGGLQRARFLPFIDVLQKHMDVVHLDSGNDYRLRALSEKGTWFYPLSDQSWGRMMALFETLTGHVSAAPASLEIAGRELPILRADARCAWLDFDTLCRQPRGAADYLALGHAFENIFLDNVPRMDEHTRNEARRFMTLVDNLYDLGRVLVIRAATTPDQLYHGDAHAFEFQRTVSRLLEMQSPEWFSKQYIVTPAKAGAHGKEVR